MRAFIVLIAFAAAVAGCAKQKGPSPAGGTESNPKGLGPVATHGFRVEAIGLDLAGPATNDPAIPGAEAFQGGLAALDPAYLTDELILRKTLNLPDSGPGHGPYFVWPQGVGQNQIGNAWYAVRTQGTDGRLVGEPNYDLADMDRDGKRFFIPLHRALSRRAQDLGPSDEQILMIRLQFTAGGVVDLTLRFRVAGPLVSLRVVKDEQTIPTLNSGMLQNAGVQVSLRRVTLENPMARTVTLWLRGEPSIQTLRIAGREYYASHPDWGARLLQWQAPLQVTRVNVTQRGQTRSFPYVWRGTGPETWSPIRFGSNEQVGIEWVATTGGCRSLHSGATSALLVDGAWGMDAWVTDGSLPTLPRDFHGVPTSLLANSGRIGGGLQTHSGDWDSQPMEINSCR